MILILTASIMYWSLQQQAADAETASDGSPVASVGSVNEAVLSSEVSNMTLDDLSPGVRDEKSSKKAEKDELSEEPSTKDETQDKE